MRSIFATLRQLVLPAGALPGTPRTVIGPDLPPPLDTYLFGGTTRASSAIITYGNSVNSYQFLAFIPGTTTASIYWMGWVRVGVVQELSAGVPYGQSWNISAGPGVISMGFYTPTNGAVQLFGGDFSIDGVSQSRGLRAVTISTVSTAAVAAETVVLTCSTVFIQPGRAYRAEFLGETVGSLASNTAIYLVRRTGVAGTILRNATAWTMSPTAGVSQSCTGPVIFRNATGALLVDDIVLTLQAFGGTVTMAAAADRTRHLEIRDIGAAASYPNAPQF